MELENPVRSYDSATLTKDEFAWIKDYLYRHAGIALNDSKRALVAGRLYKRLRHYELPSYGDYFRLLATPGFEQETSMAIDLLTTNETCFFREPGHFDFLENHFFPDLPASRPLRLWSAASSSGEEAYTLAMLTAEYAKTRQWEVFGTDISTQVLEKAGRGLYPLSAAEKIPASLLKKYCLKGTGEYEGFFMIDPDLRNRVMFRQANLTGPLPDLGRFDVIFLRNVMIYFDAPTKRRLIERIRRHIRPGGYLIISHSESINGLQSGLRSVAPSSYRNDADG